jgi:hypothetical protein
LKRNFNIIYNYIQSYTSNRVFTQSHTSQDAVVLYILTTYATIVGYTNVSKLVGGKDNSKEVREEIMPYQVLPGLAVIAGAFTLMGAGLGLVNRIQARKNHQVMCLS